MLQSRVYTSADSFQELKEAWKNLVLESESTTPFQTWEWQSTWWSYFSGAKKCRIWALYEGDDLIGLMPFYATLGPWRTLRSMGTGHSDYLQPISRKGYERVVAEYLAEYLKSPEDIDLVDLHQVREGVHFTAEFGQPSFEQARCLVLDLPSTYDEYLSMLSKSLRYDVRRLDKEMFSSGRATMTYAIADDAGQAMDWLFETHAKRWKKRGLPGAFFSKKVRTFHKEWAELGVRAGNIWLGVLHLDGNPIGAIYAMRCGKTCYYYQAGFDPEFKSISPGTLLVASTIRRAIEEGLTAFDFLRGDEPYKRRWKPQHIMSNRRLLVAVNTLGHAGSAWNGAGSKMEKKVRAKLEGKGIL